MFVLGKLSVVGLRVWGTLAHGNGGMRPVLLALLLVAVILIVAGSIIALLTLRNQRKDQLARIALEQPNSEKD